MRALIFNSGVGNRMGEFTRHHHKSTARLANGETIFGRQLRVLAANGVTDIVVTTGPHADQLREIVDAPQFAALDVAFVANERYDQTNYIYSMHLARSFLDDDVLMLHGDLVFNSAVLARMLADPRPDLGAIDSGLPLPDKDFKARLRGDLITEVSVTASGPDCVAFQPMYKLSRRAIGLWLEQVGRLVEAGDTGVYAENALNQISAEVGVRTFSYAEGFVNEVDNLDDLAAVSGQVRLFDFAEQPILAEPDDVRRIPDLLASAGVARPLVVGGSGFRSSVVEQVLTEAGIAWTGFSGYSSNPRLEEVRAGVETFHREGCDGLISVGGGSAMDVAKCIKLLVAGDATEFPEPGSPLRRALPHLAVPTTAGTGSESTHFAVVYVDGEKHSVAHDAMLPDWVLLEPALLEALPDYHKKASLLDAAAQCVESLWASASTAQSRDYARRGLTMILDDFFAYFHKAVPFDAEVTRRMLVAANLGGKAINLTKTTAPHAMSYGLTSLYGIAHGHAAALCLRGVWRWHIDALERGEPAAVGVEPALEALREIFGARSPLGAVQKLEAMIEAMRLDPPVVRDPSELDQLVAGVNAERLGNSPVPLDPADLRRIYGYVLLGRPLAPGDPVAEASDAEPSRAQLSHRELAELQELELEILSAFDRFCDEYGLQYYLSEGSILGAIRHGGFIPWDDDVDVMMPRADYRRFVELARQGKLPDWLNLDCFETNPGHWVFGAKLQTTRPTRFHLPKIVHLASFNGPYIDIFPIDAVDQTSGPKLKLQAFLLRVMRRALFMSSGRSRGLRRNPLARVPLFLATRIVRPPTLHRWITWVQSQFNAGPTATHWANLCSYYPIEREVFPKEWFGDGKRVGFEAGTALVPAEAERMLARIYGDAWRAIPSLSVRKARSHAFALGDQRDAPDISLSPGPRPSHLSGTRSAGKNRQSNSGR